MCCCDWSPDHTECSYKVDLGGLEDETLDDFRMGMGVLSVEGWECV